MKWLIEDLAEFGRIDEGSKVKLKGQWWVATSTSINGWCELQECEAPIITTKVFTEPLNVKDKQSGEKFFVTAKELNNEFKSYEELLQYYDIVA